MKKYFSFIIVIYSFIIHIEPYLLFFSGAAWHIFKDAVLESKTWLLFLGHKTECDRVNINTRCATLSLLVTLTSREHPRPFFPEALAKPNSCQRKQYLLYKYGKPLKLKTEKRHLYFLRYWSEVLLLLLLQFSQLKKKISQKKKHTDLRIWCMLQRKIKEGKSVWH